jgi:uncharacterized protein YndB with AHSA1/START domain
MALIIGVVLAAVVFAAPAAADIIEARESGFVVQSQATVSAPPERAWRAVIRPERWWSSAHTYSGDARNLSLDPHAGGCWCERWGRNQSVEHGRVVLVMDYEGVQTLRVLGGFGPLQEMGVNGVLTLVVAPDPSGASMQLTYRVSGEPSAGLDALAPAVDAVMSEQFARLVRLVERGVSP